MSPLRHPVVLLCLFVVAAGATWRLIKALEPLLMRYALARPNARSSHATPTPQGAGIAIIAVVAAITAGALILDHDDAEPWRVALVLAAIAGLGVVGAWDDIRPLPWKLRLALQFAAAAALVAALPPGLRALAYLPAPLETAILVVGLVWFINLTNFMDGIDWITVVEMGSVAAMLFVMSCMGVLPAVVGAMALALAGALAGFAPYNKPVARLFLGDVGSLAIGGLVGWMLIILAGRGQIAAALILPMYYLADSGLTLLRRWRRGERLSEAHRSHVYQIATRRGFTVTGVVGRVLALNVALAVLAGFAARVPGGVAAALALATAIALTGLLLHHLEHGAPA